MVLINGRDCISFVERDRNRFSPKDGNSVFFLFLKGRHKTNRVFEELQSYNSNTWARICKQQE